MEGQVGFWRLWRGELIGVVAATLINAHVCILVSMYMHDYYLYFRSLKRKEKVVWRECLLQKE